MVKIEINFTDRWLYSFIVIAGILILGVGVYAYGTNNPPIMGHSSGEIDGVCRSDGGVATCGFLGDYALESWVQNNFVAIVVPIPDTTPLAPTGLTRLQELPTSIDMSWTDRSDDETRFEIQRDGSAIVGTPGPGATSYTDTGLASSTTYTYRVRACNSAPTPCSLWSNTITGTTCASEENCP